MSDQAQTLEQEILSRHPDWEREEQEKRDEAAEKDMERFEVGSDHR